MAKLEVLRHMSRTELVKVLLSVPGYRNGEPVFTIYEVRSEEKLTEGQARHLLPLKVGGHDLVIDLTPRDKSKIP